MTDKTFASLAVAHGGDNALWPEASRAGAEALLTTSAVARAALEEARALDRALARAADEVEAPDAGLMSRLLADAAAETAARAPEAKPVQVRREPSRWFSGLTGLLRPAAFAASAVAGLAIGYAAPDAIGLRILEAADRSPVELGLLEADLFPEIDPFEVAAN